MAVTLPFKANFRSTAAFATDAGGETGVISTGNLNGNPGIAYAAGSGYGWLAQNSGTRDRSSIGGEQEVAGIHFNEIAALCSFQVDLPSAGTYAIKFLSGDISNGFTTKVELFDNTTSLGSVSGTVTAGNFLDATGATVSAANWNLSTAVTKTFATSTLIIKIGDNVSTATGVIAHLEIAAVAITSIPAVVGGGVGTQVVG